MAPRQRQFSEPSLDEMHERAALLEDDIDTVSERSTSSASREKSPPRSPVSQQQQVLSDIAREQHDIFNLVALVFVIGTTLINWDFWKFVQGYGPDQAWTGQYFYANWATTVLYFIIDLLWIARVPICVKSPQVIVKHHLVAVAYLSGPIVWAEYRWFMGACLSVEINTWFLILRRLVYKRRDAIPQAVSDAVTMLFYLSWIVIRCFIYPAILVIFLQLAYEKVLATDILFHWPMMFIPVHFFLCVLNLKWSYDLFQPIVKKLVFPDGGPDGPTVSSGL